MPYDDSHPQQQTIIFNWESCSSSREWLNHRDYQQLYKRNYPAISHELPEWRTGKGIYLVVEFGQGHWGLHQPCLLVKHVPQLFQCTHRHGLPNIDRKYTTNSQLFLKLMMSCLSVVLLRCRGPSISHLRSLAAHDSSLFPADVHRYASEVLPPWPCLCGSSIAPYSVNQQVTCTVFGEHYSHLASTNCSWMHLFQLLLSDCVR